MATIAADTDGTKRKRGRPRGSKTTRAAPPPLTRMGLRINEFAAAMGMSRSAVYNAIKRGELREMKIGTCRIIPASEMERLLHSAFANAS